MLLFLYYLVSNYLTHKDATPPTDGQHLSAKIWQYWILTKPHAVLLVCHLGAYSHINISRAKNVAMASIILWQIVGPRSSTLGNTSTAHLTYRSTRVTRTVVVESEDDWVPRKCHAYPGLWLIGTMHEGLCRLVDGYSSSWVVSMGVDG